MTDFRKKILNKINQGGSMMVEAMAMLALIALVTPTLYKKSAERTTELQDINTANHIRTLSNAVDNYVSKNYQALLEDDAAWGANDTISIALDDAEFLGFLPYGYSFESLKNFNAPIITLKKATDADTKSITAFVQLPKKTDIGEMRAARIASMVGSNGGYINNTGEAKGVGGVWNLSNEEVGNLGLNGEMGSVVVASTEAINSATSGALENEIYLQSTPAGDGEKWRNTMRTDLYMAETDTVMHKIIGASQVVIGENAEAADDYGLVIGGNKDAMISGSLEAIGGEFFVDEDSFNYYDLIEANNAEGSVNIVGDTMFVDDTAGVQINEKGLAVKGSVSLAMDDDATFSAGDGGKFISAGYNATNNKPEVIIGEKLTVTEDLLKSESKQNEFVNSVKIGDGNTLPSLLTEEEKKPENLKLNVQGNAYVSGTLEAGTIRTGDIDLKELHAGGNEPINADKSNRWLHATADGVKVTDITNSGKERLVVNAAKTGMYNKDGSAPGEATSYIELGDANAIVQGKEELELRTSETGKVLFKFGENKVPLELNGKNDIVSINSATTLVQSNEFKIGAVVTGEGVGDAFYINTQEGGEGKISTAKLTVSNNPLFQVLPEDGTDSSNEGNEENTSPSSAETTKGSVLTVNPQQVYVSADDGSTQIFAVNVSEDQNSHTRDKQRNASVYIRRGAIEIEQNPVSSGVGADGGVGYVEAGRFVSNALDKEHSLATPVFAGDYNVSDYYGSDETVGSSSTDDVSTEYDRYMVNPAYTSVMHDIKLTTRGGARLSDMLPDFINKGIYVVTNTYEDTLNINKIVVKETLKDGQLDVEGATDMISNESLVGTNKWSSAFLGVVPAPQCPPGHARVITITPAGFKMAQAGRMVNQKAKNPFGGGENGESDRFVIMGTGQNQENALANAKLEVGTTGTSTVKYPTIKSANISSTPGSMIYYLGYQDRPEHYGALSPTEHGTDLDWSPEPLYFQQSTWLRSKVIPQNFGKEGDCNQYTTDAKNGCDDFAGWTAVMGFVYPRNHYAKIINKLMGKDLNNEENLENYYWNVFPVETGTLEGYATVYCYFDRTNLFSSGIDGKYVDQYDQLNSFRRGKAKSAKSDDEGNNTIEGFAKNASGVMEKQEGNNAAYLERLDDPSLQYKQPW